MRLFRTGLYAHVEGNANLSLTKKNFANKVDRVFKCVVQTLFLKWEGRLVISIKIEDNSGICRSI